MSGNKIAVSVILPVYNAEEYLEKCLDSIVNQTLRNIEIIIIDDGSKDGSTDICKSYAEKDSRIIYYRKENEGLAAARQDGMERASGEYIGFVDSDDWLELNMYERMYDVAAKEEADVVFCNCYLDETGKDKIHLAPGVYNREAIERDILPRSLSDISEKGTNGVIRWCNWLRIYRTDLIKKHNLSFDRRFRRSQDLQLTFESALYAEKYVSLNDEYLYHNRTEDNAASLSRGYTKGYWGLIRPLIDVLARDVDSYKKQNLWDRMHLCIFFFAASGAKNEYEGGKATLKTKIKKLDEIARDEAVQKALPFVEYSKLSDYYKAIYDGLKGGSGLSLYKKYFLYDFYKNKYKPMARKFFDSKIGQLYSKVR